MELGLEFDDDDLDSARDKNRNDTCLPYVVKMCSPQVICMYSKKKKSRNVTTA